jgi:hypothetical protein
MRTRRRCRLLGAYLTCSPNKCEVYRVFFSWLTSCSATDTSLSAIWAVSVSAGGWPASIRMRYLAGVRFAPKEVFGLLRKRCSIWTEMSDRFAPKYSLGNTLALARSIPSKE